MNQRKCNLAPEEGGPEKLGGVWACACTCVVLKSLQSCSVSPNAWHPLACVTGMYRAALYSWAGQAWFLGQLSAQ